MLWSFSKCKSCSGSSGSIMPRTGDKAKILFIGTCPTELESIMGITFTGDELFIIKDMLHKAGLSLMDCNFVHGIMCHFSEPTKTEQLNCLPNLLEVFRNLNPMYLVFVGAESRRRYEKKFKEYDSAWITHPAAIILSGGQSSPVYAENINRLRSIHV